MRRCDRELKDELRSASEACSCAVLHVTLTDFAAALQATTIRLPECLYSVLSVSTAHWRRREKALYVEAECTHMAEGWPSANDPRLEHLMKIVLPVEIQTEYHQNTSRNVSASYGFVCIGDIQLFSCGHVSAQTYFVLLCITLAGE